MVIRFDVRFALDTFIVYQFLNSYFFLVEMRKKTYSSLTAYNKRVIAATMVMLGIFLAMAYIGNVCSSL